MRKFAVTAFAVLYGIFVLSLSTERFSDWLAQEASALGLSGHSASGQHAPGFGMTKSETHPRQQKIVEQGFVVESPRERFGVPDSSVRHALQPCSEYQTVWSGQPDCSRAPPSRI